ncbi:hypothetical protein HELRODRAFT_191945 [Helobdella robusta]|uniref:Malate dehydrogenase n=1 Tax=Helobdella robusta TaxID=6412 RepID=T1FTF8_HELRO|nr:hypothetical protein HELRODRAFT_191945 [Helobdella robusta]ESO03740.1 hypothetical protein HELRODRAFT_191945 [Helobdella robusta]
MSTLNALATIGASSKCLLKSSISTKSSAVVLTNFFRNYATSQPEVGGICIANDEVKAFIERSMTAVGTRPAHATALAENLTMADYRGHFSHGLNRLEMYVKDIQSGITVSDKEPVILKESAATAHVDGSNLLGPIVGKFSMEIAIKKAKEAGVGFVSAKGSNHYGIAGFYSLMACEQGLLGMSFTNTSPLVLPTRGRKACLGTNPLSLAAPGKGVDTFVLDMATSSVALGKIELNAVKKIKIPRGWGADGTGHVTEDPDLCIKEGGLLPLGGAEETSGYKGYGLAMLVEIFCGILSGGEFGPRIRKWKETNRVANLGQCYIAINPDNFAPGFTDRMQILMNLCRQSDLAEGEKEILIAGDPERKHINKCDRAGGITYHPNVIALLDVMADKLKIERIVVKK